MSLSADDTFVWDRFDQVNVDLSDVTGSPGLPEPADLAERLTHGFDGRVSPLATTNQVFLVGEFSRRLLGAPQAKVSGFLAGMEEAVPDSGVGAENAQVLASKESSTGRHLVVQQTVQGAEIIGARFQIHIGEDDRAYALTGRPIGDILSRDPGEAPKRSEREAIEALQAHLDLPRGQRMGIRRVVFPLEGRGIWAYEGRCVIYDPVADLRALVRADDLSLLLCYNVAAAALRGEAKVYRVNPLRTPGLEVVRLDHMGPIPSDRPMGAVVEVKPQTGAGFSQAARDCRLEPADAGFDEVHAFYHLGQAARYFDDLLESALMQAAPFAPIKAVVGVPHLQEAACFVPGTGELLFGDWQSRPTARSADVIYHEFSHAVSDAICHLGRWRLDSPARAMSEGYSDYFTASALADPRVGDYLADRPEGVRDCSKPDLKFPPGDQGREHAVGEVWASVLWAIRGRSGEGVADVLAAESLQFLHQMATVEEGCAALLSADQRLFPGDQGRGRHADIIEDEFNRRRP